MRKQSYTIQEVARLVEFSDQTIREWAGGILALDRAAHAPAPH